MLVITDSICLKLISTNFILVGVGNELRYYFTNNQHKTTQKIFHRKLQDKIHGICVVERQENVFDIVAYGGKEFIVMVLKENELHFQSTTIINDWINSVHLYEREINHLCLLSSHGVALKILLNYETKENQIIEKIVSADKSTLYCSRIEGDTWNTSIILCGTALGDLFIWSIGKEKPGTILYRLSGHKGVIFSIDYNMNYNYITTTSDDRSIKIWQLDFVEKNNKNYNNCIIKPIKSLFGHTARVFCSKIIAEGEELFIISIGEDANICLWTIFGELLYRRKLQTAAVLWDLDYDPSTKTVFTCGSDGNVSQWCIRQVLQRCTYKMETVYVNNLLDNEYISKIKCLNNGKLVGLTNHNNLFVQISNNNWVCVKEFGSYKSSLLEVYDNFIATAGFKVISIFELSISTKTLKLIYEKHLMENMIRTFKFISKNEVLVCDDKGNCALIDITTSNIIYFSLPYCKEKWITVALKYLNFLVVGDRSGNLHLFEIEMLQIVLKNSLKHVHGKLGCTSLHLNSESSFLSAGHDGTLKTIDLDINNKSIFISFTQKISIIWIDKLIFHHTNEMMVAGFNDNYFVLLNSDQEVILEIECGGGHRYWDLYVDYHNSCCYFLYIRNKMLQKITFNLNSYIEHPFNIPRTNWHSKACNVATTIMLNNNELMLISGGDDNILKFSRYNLEESSTLHHLNDMILHISNIKTISVVKSKPDTIIVFSAGGRAQICVTEVIYNKSKFKLKEITNYMLNLSDLERKKQGKANFIDFDPETRFMSLVVCHVNNYNNFTVLIGCSDGFLRVFSYIDYEFRLEDLINYGRCLLHIHKFETNSNQILLTMATDGFICFWNLETFKANATSFYKLQHHRSGINSFDFMSIKNKHYIATGGDDQAVVISVFELSKTFDVVLEKTINFKNIHTAQVNGVKFSNEHLCLYTASVDQVMFKIDLSTFSVNKVANYCVADIKGINVITNENYSKSNTVIVYGSGLELLNV